MMEILHRYTGAVLYSSATAHTIAAAVAEALRNEIDLRGVDFREADLRGVNFRGADLRGADLRGVDFREADLRGVNFREADLRWADLRGVDLRGVDLRGADLRGASLETVVLHLVGSCHVLTAYSDRVSVGCHTHDYDYWMAHYEAIGRANGYTPEQIEEYGKLIRKAQAMMAVAND